MLRLVLAAALAACIAAPAQGTTATISGTTAGDTINLGSFGGGSYRVNIAFDGPVQIADVMQHQYGISGECPAVYDIGEDCDWSGDYSWINDFEVPFAFDGTNLSFTLNFESTTRIVFGGGNYEEDYWFPGEAYVELAAAAPGTPYLAKFSFVPEAGTWAMMLLGFGFLGITQRRRRHQLLTA